MRELLRSWKEIASHLGASVRTVQRWEREFRLPVRRLDAKRGAVVFAFSAELDRWLRQRSDARLHLVQDSFFRTVFMDSQFPSLVVDDVTRILAANFAAASLAGRAEVQLLGKELRQILCAGRHNRPGDWAGFLTSGACWGQANVSCGDGHIVGVEFVIKRFLPGLHVVSVLVVRKPWPSDQLCCRLMPQDFSFRVRPTGSGTIEPVRRNHAPVVVS